MAYTWADNVHTTAFTPRDYQVELLASAYEENIIVCIEQNNSKEFIALKLIHELGNDLRCKDNPKTTIYLPHEKDGVSTYNLIFHLTDLEPLNCCSDPKSTDTVWTTKDFLGRVVIIQPEKFLSLLDAGVLLIDYINLIVVENCHKLNISSIREIFNKHYIKSKNRPKILGLAGPFHNAGCPLGRLRAEIQYLEEIVCCRAETASDIVTLLRYCTKPKEIIVQSAPLACNQLIYCLAQLCQSKIDYLMDHRFDPTEIYSEEYYDELKNIPDPKDEPLTFLNDFLQVLKEFGPWCADRAALALLIQIEKSKVKTPYERHFLLLCMTSTTFVHIRAYCDSYFSQLSCEKERIFTYSSPKVLKLLSILENFKPDPKAIGKISPNSEFEKESEYNDMQNNQKSQNFHTIIDNMITELNSMDFKSLTMSNDQIDEHVKSLTEIQESTKLKDTLRNITEKTLNVQPNVTNSPMRSECRPSRGRRKNIGSQARQNRAANNQATDPDALCGLIFCDTEFTAKVLFSLLYEVSKSEGDLNYLSVQYIVDKVADPLKEVKQAETEHRKQEEVLKRFRMHECNLLIGTSILEKEIDLPKCNLVIRWNPPKTYRSYVQCKGRARALNAHHIVMIGADVQSSDFFNEKVIEKNSDDSSLDDKDINQLDDPSCKCASDETALEQMKKNTEKIIKQFAEYAEIENMLLSSCANNEPDHNEITLAEKYTNCILPYKPLPAFDAPYVNLSTAVALVNKYCAKLPSDTFTKLTPIWRYEEIHRKGVAFYKCSLRLPINSPLKCDINGYFMPTRTLARRITALITCRLLHQCGELDDNLQPIGKEGYRAFEPDWEDFELESSDELLINDNLEPRPGTTKRRQYYYKRVASSLSNCRPVINQKCYFYNIEMILKCPIPEEQNTRGRKIYPPEESLQGFGILTLKKIPQISAFPIFTRSGEVEVDLKLISSDVVLCETKLQHINSFINYTFTNVLRLQKYLMLFDPDANENCYFVVPTMRQEDNNISIDWAFLKLINDNAHVLPQTVPEEERAVQQFDANKFKDAVVMPWYRNQDQPQYFYVAEICFHLSPESSFPGENYSTFREYYFLKYNIQVQNCKQPLLDVDHTSARLNFLTPRYVNRKGVALPTSSEETKRAKRENLEQKQILVPELCTIHPFSASLWRAAVCLPCILYRFNALLLADEIRCQVSQDLGLGQMINNQDFEWPSLDFGWSLAEVLKKSRESAKTDSFVNEKCKESSENHKEKAFQAEKSEKHDSKLNKKMNGMIEHPGDYDDEKSNASDENLMEIGTWSNEMANDVKISFEGITGDQWTIKTPNQIRYGSPTSWNAHNQTGSVFDPSFYDTDSDDSLQSDVDETESVKSEGKMRIEFKSDNLAEAIETEEEIVRRQKKLALINDMIQGSRSMESGENDYNNLQRLAEINFKASMEECEEKFGESIMKNIETIEKSDMLVKYNEEVVILKKKETVRDANSSLSMEILSELLPYADNQDIRRFYENGGVTIDDLKNLNVEFIKQHDVNESQNVGSGHIFDKFIGYKDCMPEDEFIENRRKKLQQTVKLTYEQMHENYKEKESNIKPKDFSFDYQPNLRGHPGPSPSIILQALTMSNANDGINLERLETIGDSFLKYAITTYLYCTYEDVHEGKLSHLRSKQVSNLNLYRLGRRKMLGESMISTKFEPHDNWLPPCYYIPKELEKALIEARIPACHWNLADLPNLKEMSSQDICNLIRDRASALGLLETVDKEDAEVDSNLNFDNFPCFIPYNLVTQHSIPDKSIADCVEALIGAYLIECGPRGALLFMAWVGIRVLPCYEIQYPEDAEYLPGTSCDQSDNSKRRTVYGWWAQPKSPLLDHFPQYEKMLIHLLDGFDQFEQAIGYEFRDKSYLLQAMTHASYSPNRLTDCYQRLEFLGDAVLDYLITRHLYEDPRQHSPGALTDLRSALVNNTIFASLAVRHGFHKYFRHLSPGLNEVIDRFVRFQHENGHSISEEYYLISEDECDEAEDVEVPKALGDVFESVAGAIFLDSGMSLDAVWKVYSAMMRPEIEQFSNSVPKSPIRELLELEPETAKFSKPEKLADGRRVRVMVEVFGKGTFRGIGRNYRIAKCTAAKCALRQLKKHNLLNLDQRQKLFE